MTLRTSGFHFWHPGMARDLARLIAGVWAFFWTWFGMASGLAEGMSIPGTLVHMAPGLLFTAVVWLAFRHPTAGGLALLLGAFLIFIYYPLMASHMAASVVATTVLMLGAPPLIAGLLFLLHREP